MRFTVKDAEAMAERAGRGQDVKEEIKVSLADGPKTGMPAALNRGESIFEFALLTYAKDIADYQPARNAFVFPPPDNRRCDFCFYPIPLVVEIQGSVHQVVRKEGTYYPNWQKMEFDCSKFNDYHFHGIFCLTFTTSQLERDPMPAMEQVRRALAICRERPCVPWYTPEGVEDEEEKG